MKLSLNRVKIINTIIFLMVVLIVLSGCTEKTVPIAENNEMETIKSLQKELGETEEQLTQLRKQLYSKHKEIYSNIVNFNERMANISILHGTYYSSIYNFEEKRQRGNFGYIDIYLNNFFKHSFTLHSFKKVNLMSEHEEFIASVQAMRFDSHHKMIFLDNIKQRPFIHHHLPNYIYIGVNFHSPIQFDNEEFDMFYVRNINNQTELLLHSTSNKWHVYSSNDVLINEELNSVVILTNLLHELSGAIEYYEELQNK